MLSSLEGSIISSTEGSLGGGGGGVFCGEVIDTVSLSRGVLEPINSGTHFRSHPHYHSLE